MSDKILTPAEAEEHQRLYIEWVAAVITAGEILQSFGMSSPQFLDADAKAGRISNEIRKLLGTQGQHWMAG